MNIKNNMILECEVTGNFSKQRDMADTNLGNILVDSVTKLVNSTVNRMGKNLS